MWTSGGSSWITLRGSCDSLGGLWWYLSDDGRAEQLTAWILELADGDGRHHDTPPAPTGPVEHGPDQPQAGALAGAGADGPVAVRRLARRRHPAAQLTPIPRSGRDFRSSCTTQSADAPGTMGTQSNWKRLNRWGRRTIGAGLSGGVMVALPALLAGAAPANAAALAVPRLLVTASPSATVGLQIFANVNLMDAAQPTGTLTFRLFGPADASCTSAPVFVSTVPVTGTSVNSQRFTSDRAGTWRWTASYSGDAANTAAGPTSCAEPAAAVI